MSSKHYPFIKKRPAHLVIAERALGKPLPKGSHVHHVDEDETNYANSNLVICQDAAYHKLLHYRTHAYDATGNADAVRCGYCSEWTTRDNPDLKDHSRGSRYQHKFVHRHCKRSSTNKIQRQRTTDGLCVTCRTPVSTKTRCERCIAVIIARRQQRIADGLCAVCGRDRAGSKNIRCVSCTTKKRLWWARSQMRIDRMEKRKKCQLC